QSRHVWHPRKTGQDIHRHRRAGHPRSPARAYRTAVMASAEAVLGTSESSAAADVDRLLAGYRAARAQQALFDLRDSPRIGYDEFVDEAGNVRPGWTELAAAVGERGRAGLDRLRSVVHRLIDNDGITYTGVDADRGGAAA